MIEFPKFKDALKCFLPRREERRQAALRKHTCGMGYRNFAALIIQRDFRMLRSRRQQRHCKEITSHEMRGEVRQCKDESTVVESPEFMSHEMSGDLPLNRSVPKSPRGRRGSGDVAQLSDVAVLSSKLENPPEWMSWLRSEMNAFK